MEDRDWLILHSLYQHKNITKTAQALFISQPALTARLRQIEDEFGAKIVSRSTKGVHFTPQGEYLAKTAARLILDARKIKEHVHNMEQEVLGTLIIGASGYFTKYKLPRLLRLFRDQYPKVEFQVSTTWSKDVFNALYNQAVHVGFVRGDYNWQSGRHLLARETTCIASTQTFSLADLPHLPRIDYQTESHIDTVLTNWWRDNFSEPPFISMSVNQVDTCKEMVLNGLGYALLPSAILSDTDTLCTHVLTDKTGQPILRNTWMLYDEETLEIKTVKAFVDFVKALEVI